MGAYVAVVAYSWLAHGIGYAIARVTVADGLLVRMLILWALAVLVLYTIIDPIPVFLVVGFFMLALAPQQPAERVSFFLLAAPCLPISLIEAVSLPGINNLLLISPYKMAVIVVLLPMFALASPYPRLTRFGASDALILMFVFYSGIITGSQTIATGGFRNIVDLMLTIAVPYMAIHYALRSKRDVTTFLTAFLVASILLAAIALVSTAKQWDLYQFLKPPSTVNIPDTRSGFLRIGGPFNPHSLGFHMVMAIMALEYLKAELKLGALKLMGLRLMLLAALFFTDSRGSFGGLALAAALYVVLTVKSKALRSLMITGIFAAGLVSIWWLLFKDHSETDVHGTFSYRQELVRTGINHLLEYPVFGDFHFIDRRAFAHLIQGQGIIDITNYYLQVALPLGLLGAGLLFAGLIIPIVPLARKVGRIPREVGVGIRMARRGVVELRHQPFGFAIAVLVAAAVMPIVLLLRATGAIPSRSARHESSLPEEAKELNSATSRPVPVVDQLASATGSKEETLHRACAFVVATSIGWFFFMSTTSDHGVTTHYGVILAALARVLSALADQSIASAADGPVALPQAPATTDLAARPA